MEETSTLSSFHIKTNTYKTLSDREHILESPEIFVGSTKPTNVSRFLINSIDKFDKENTKFEWSTIQIVPALVKIFDEVLINAADHTKNPQHNVSYIKIKIKPKSGVISVENNGVAIPLGKNEQEDSGVHVPQAVFFIYKTSSNFKNVDGTKKDEGRAMVGGKNGYGVKLTATFSKYMKIKIKNSHDEQIYKQTSRNNNEIISSPKIKPLKSSIDDKSGKKDMVKVTFLPDYAYFGGELDENHLRFFYSRVIDIAGTVGPKINVKLNGISISSILCKKFQQYASLHHTLSNNNVVVAIEECNERWTIGVIQSTDSKFHHTSFVNNISTSSGGTHVQYVLDQLVNGIVDILMKKIKSLDENENKRGLVKEIQKHVHLFINANIENTSYTSQMKEKLDTIVADFGDASFLPKLTDKFLKRVVKLTELETKIGEWYTSQTMKRLKNDLEGKNNGNNKNNNPNRKHQTRVTGISDYDDANLASRKTKKNDDPVTLIICEGLSAKQFVRSAYSVIGRDYFGCLPIRGKLLNVRNASLKTISNNKETKNLIRVMGLEMNEDYSTEKKLRSLRYQRVMILTDADMDGKHIIALIINLFMFFWPSLLQNHDDFMSYFLTPITLAIPKNPSLKNHLQLAFYSEYDSDKWIRECENQTKHYNVRFLKGIGSSTSKDIQSYFHELTKHQVFFTYSGDPCQTAIVEAMSDKKSCIQTRKQWILTYDPLKNVISYVDGLIENQTMTYKELVHKELIQFSLLSINRAIPSVVDSFKVVQRKVIFGCFKKKIFSESVKVAQLGALIATLTQYHHGEVSLIDAIVNLAQDFVGCGNVALLFPDGQFGSRHDGGNDSAAPRYIATRLTKISQLIFPQEDNPILHYLEDEGHSIEPNYLLPICPLVLLNGAAGIATGFSTFVPCYNPREIVQCLRYLLSNEDEKAQDIANKLVPWYHGFRGTIHSIGLDKYVSKGHIHSLSENERHIIIDELPIQVWTKTYVEMLEFWLERGIISDLNENSMETTIRFEFKINELYYTQMLNGTFKKPSKDKEDEQQQQEEESESLETTTTTSTTHLEKIESLYKPLQLIKSMSTANMHLIDVHGKIKLYKNVYEILMDFYAARLEGYKKRKQYQIDQFMLLLPQLQNEMRFIQAIINDEIIIKHKSKSEIETQLTQQNFSDFSRLMNMSMMSMSNEHVQSLQKRIETVQDELLTIQSKSPESLWLSDLTNLESELLLL